MIKENYTKIPNAILDAMPGMSKAELKLTAVLVRLTYGYHREEIKMTYDDMQEATGLSRGGLTNAVEAVKKTGFFHRGNKSMWYTSGLVSRPKSTDKDDEIVQPVDQSSPTSRPKSIDQSLTSRPLLLDKEKEEKKIYTNGRDYELPADQYPYPDEQMAYEEMLSAIERVVSQVYSPGLKGADEFEATGAAFLRDGITPEQVLNFREWWKENTYYKDKSKSKKPYLKTLRDEIKNSLAGEDAPKLLPGQTEYGY